MSYIKSEFVKRILQDEGKRLIKNQGGAIAKRVKFHTNRLLNDRHISVTGGDNMDGQLQFTHPHYERLLDIKRTVRNKNTNRASTRSRRIHNRFIFGHYFSISRRLMTDFTDEVVEQIRKDFHNK